MMEISVLPTIDHYFMKNELFRNDFMQNVMSGKHLTRILSMLRFSPSNKPSR